MTSFARVVKVSFATSVLALAAGCLVEPGGYAADDPTRITCACGDGIGCYEAAAHLAERSGETAETGEELLYFAQCACFQGAMAGCNTVGHFAKDWVRSCDAGEDVRDACAIAGYVHEHGVRVPGGNGRSFPRNATAASAAFKRACDAGAKTVCERAGG